MFVLNKKMLYNKIEVMIMSTQFIGLKMGSINTSIFKAGNGLVLKEASLIAMPTNPKNKEVYAK